MSTPDDIEEQGNVRKGEKVTGKIYKPVYKEIRDKNGTKILKPYYLNGRMSKPGFICLNVCGAIVLLLLLILPLTYFVIFPNFLQGCIDNIGTEGNPVRIWNQTVGKFESNMIPFHGQIRINKWSILPLPGGFGANTIELVTLGDEKRLASISVPGAAFKLNEEIRLQTDGKITWDEEQEKNVQELLAKLSTTGLNDFGLRIKLNAPIMSSGMTLYSSLPLHRDIPIGDVEAADILKALIPNPDVPQMKSVFHPFEFIPLEGDNGAALRSRFRDDEIMTLPASLGGLDMVWSKLSVDMNDNGMGASLGLAFENWSPLGLSKIEQIDSYIALQGVRVAKVTIRNVALEQGLNANFTPSFEMDFIGDLISPDAVQTAIELASQSFATTANFGFALMGPIKITGADFVEKVTKDLVIPGTVQQLLAIAPKDLLNLVAGQGKSAALKADASDPVQDLLGNSTIKLDVGNDLISATVGLNLPALSFVKPPKDIAFPYSLSLGIYATDSKVIQFDTLPVTVSTGFSGMFINTGLDIAIQNSDAAATGLANAINPILASNPKNSSIGIKDFIIRPPEGKAYKWTELLFGQRVLNIGLPAIDKAALIDSMNSPTMANTGSKLFQLATGPVTIGQLTDRPGFGANGNVKLSLAPGLPQININLGYLNVDTTVEDVKLASLGLPNGIKFSPSSTDINIEGAMVLNRDTALQPKIQKIADALLKKGSAPSSFGITGMSFGQSAASHIVTFSKIALDLDTSSILRVVDSAIKKGPPIPMSLPSGLIKLFGADVNQQSSSALVIGADANLNNPTSIGLSLGSVSLATTLNGKALSGITLAPLKVSPGNSPVHLGLTLNPQTGSNGLSDDVASAIKAILAKDETATMMAGIGGLTLSPPGVTSGPAVIDQFQNIHFEMPTGSIIKILNIMSKSSASAVGPGPLDASALLPSDDLLSQLAPALKFVQFKIPQASDVSAGLDADYKNPLPVSASLPFASVSAILDGGDSVDISVSGIQLTRISGTAKPRIVVGLQPSLPEKASKLLDQFLSGKLQSTIAIGNIQFGGSSSDRNDLFSKIQFDATPLVAPVFENLGPNLAKKLQDLGNGKLPQDTPSTPPPALDLFKDLKIKPQSAELDVLDESSLISQIAASYSGLPFGLDVELPWTYTAVAFNKDLLLENTIQNLRIVDNRITATAVLKFADNRQAFQEVFTILGNTFWGVPMKVSDSVSLFSPLFGYSKDSHVTLLQKLGITLPIGEIVSGLTSKGLGVEMLNLDVSIQHEGVRILATTTDLGFPIKIKNSLKSEAKWAPGNTQDPSKFLTMMNAVGLPFTLPNALVTLVPPKDLTDTVKCMREALYQLATWKSYGDSARLGFLTLIGSNGKVFSKFDQAYFNGPSWLTTPPTVYADSYYEVPKVAPPTTQIGTPSSFLTVISVPNNSPLHVDAGELEIYSMASQSKEPDIEFAILTLTSAGNLVVRNKNEGGNLKSDAGYVTQANFHSNLWGFTSLDWKSLLGSAFQSPDIFRSIIRTKRDGKYVEWFNNLNSLMEDSHFTSLLLPELDQIATHFSYKSNVPSE